MTELKVTTTKDLNKEGILSVTKTMHTPKGIMDGVNDSERLSFTVSRGNKYCKCVADLRKRISFDGINFWFRGEQIGKINPKYRLRTDISKENMIAEKQKCIEKLMQCEVC